MEAPGSDAQQLTRNLMRQNIPVFMKRIEKYATSMNGTLKRVCFIGKRQWKHLFDHQLPRCSHGIQSTDLRPEQWPEILNGVEVWVMPSPSGRAVLSQEERQATYNDLGSAING
jgi:G:T/U-mismatch repair DNA glycosylase